MLPFHGRRTQGQAEMRRDTGMGMGMGHVLPFHGRRTQGQAEMRRDMGMGMGWGGACVTVPWKENTRTSRDEKRYGDGDGDGVGHVLPFHGRRTQG